MRILSDLGIHPVLVDVGASESPPAVWSPIARQSVYVGFDPDLREMKETTGGHFYNEIIVNQAITSDPSRSKIDFYLTKFPFCSSTLEPDLQSLSNFHFQDRFTIERRVTVSAVTLDAVLDRLKLDRIHWLKTDTQGTDLRIVMSLSDSVRRRLLALDVEPGLIDAYKREDLFADTHKTLVQQGFWLADLNVGNAVRVRAASLRAVIEDESFHYAFADRAIKKSPAYCEARYLRTLESMAQSHCGPEEYTLLWVFAMLDEQTGFAMDVALQYESLFPAERVGGLMKTETVAMLRRKASQVMPAVRMKRRIKRAFGKTSRGV
jgi:FkbM family methyltransferase